MPRMAVRSLFAHRARLFMAELAIILGVAFVVGALLYGGGVRTAMTRAQEQAQPDLSVEVSARQETGVNADLVTRLRGVAGVAAVRPLAEGPTFLVAADGTLVGVPSLDAGVAYLAGPDGTDARYPLAGGRAPGNAEEVAVDTWSARRAGWKLGDQVRVVVAGTSRRLRLVGLFTAKDARLAGGGTLAAFDATTARTQFAPTPDSWTAVALTAAIGVSDSALAQRVTPLLPQGVVARPRAVVNAAGGNDDKVEMFLFFSAAAALFVSVFLVGNTFTMLAATRARENALLRAVGATRRYVLRQVLAEALLLAVIGSALGYLLGIGVAAGLGRVFAVSGGPPVPLRMVGAQPVLAAVAVGLGVTMIAAWLPARRAAAVPPIAALRTGLPPTPKALRRRHVLGAVTTGLGVAGTASVVLEVNLLLVGPPLMLIGLIILTPLLGMWLTALLRRPLRRFAGVLGTLAVENVRRNPRRTATTASTLMIGLAICAAVTVPIASLTAYGQREADTGDTADLTVTAADFTEVGSDTATRIAGLPDVQAFTPIVHAFLRTEHGSFLDGAAVNPQQVRQLLPITVREGSLDRLGEGVAVSRAAAAAHGVRLGSTLTASQQATDLTAHPQPAQPVVALYDAPDSLGIDVLLPLDKLPGGATSRPSSVLVKAASGRIRPVKAAIRHALDNPALVVQTRAERREQIVNSFRLFLNVLYALLSVSVLIGALGVVNTMTMAVLERTREIALLRAIGLGRRQVATILRLESMIIALLGAVIGLCAGCAIGLAVVLSEDSLPPVLPWQRIGAFFLITMAIGVIASLWPARRATRAR